MEPFVYCWYFNVAIYDTRGALLCLADCSSLLKIIVNVTHLKIEYHQIEPTGTQSSSKLLRLDKISNVVFQVNGPLNTYM